MYLLSLILPSALLQVNPSDCDAYVLPLSTTINRCRQVQECVKSAFFTENNKYILEKVFLSTSSRPPIALIVKYNVSMINTSTNGHISDDDDGSGSGTDNMADGISFDFGSAASREVHYVEEIGWSTTGIHKAIRPVIFVALKPASYWWTLSFAIDNYGFPRTIEFDINIVNTSECDFLKDMTRAEVKEALEHQTVKLTYRITGKLAYIWNTDTDSLQSEDVMIFVAIVTMASIILLLLIAILPKLNNYDTAIKKWNRSTFLLPIMVLEIFLHLFYIFLLSTNIKLYSVIRFYLGWTMLLIVIMGSIYGALTSCCLRKNMLTSTEFAADTFLVGACFAVYLLPTLIEAAIYPTEIISSTGYILISVISMPTAHRVLKTFLIGGTEESLTKAKKTRCCNRLKMALVTLCVYILLPILLFILLIFYMSLLKLLFETPTSQLTQIMLAFLPPILVGFGSYGLRKNLGKGNDQQKSSKKKSSVSDSEEIEDDQISEKGKCRYSKLATKQTEKESDNLGNRNPHQQSGEQSRKRVRSGTGRHGKLQESNSHELHVVLVKRHEGDTSDSESESTI